MLCGICNIERFTVEPLRRYLESKVSLYPCPYIQRVPFRKFHFTYDNSPASILCSHCMSVRLSSILRSRPESFRLRSIPPLVTGLETAGGGATSLGRLAVSLRACSLSIFFTCSNNNTSGIRHFIDCTLLRSVL